MPFSFSRKPASARGQHRSGAARAARAGGSITWLATSTHGGSVVAAEPLGDERGLVGAEHRAARAASPARQARPRWRAGDRDPTSRVSSTTSSASPPRSSVRHALRRPSSPERGASRQPLVVGLAGGPQPVDPAAVARVVVLRGAVAPRVAGHLVVVPHGHHRVARRAGPGGRGRRGAARSGSGSRRAWCSGRSGACGRSPARPSS